MSYRTHDSAWCWMCKKSLPISSFWRDSSTPDGLCCRCKDCSKKMASADHYRERHRKYERTARLTVARIAREKAGNAIASGVLKKGPCEKCGAEQTQAHHDDYSKPLEVRWLCRQHHYDHHRALRNGGSSERRKSLALDTQAKTLELLRQHKYLTTYDIGVLLWNRTGRRNGARAAFSILRALEKHGLVESAYDEEQRCFHWRSVATSLRKGST